MISKKNKTKHLYYGESFNNKSTVRIFMHTLLLSTRLSGLSAHPSAAPLKAASGELWQAILNSSADVLCLYIC